MQTVGAAGIPACGIAARNSVSYGYLQWCGQECPHLLRFVISTNHNSQFSNINSQLAITLNSQLSNINFLYRTVCTPPLIARNIKKASHRAWFCSVVCSRA